MRAVPSTLRQQVIELREQQRLSLRDIAERTGLGATTCARILKECPLTNEERGEIWRSKIKGQRRTPEGRLASGPDFTGKRFGRLLVLNREFSDGRHARWLCLCDCGTETTVRVDCLYRGITSSCGCLARDLARQREQKDPDSVNLTSLFLGYKNGAKHREIPFALTRAEFENFLNKNCVYCGTPPSNVRRVHKNQTGDRDTGYCYNGIDRVNSSLGYTLENCVTCCADCNQAKRDKDRTHFIAWLKRAAEFQAKESKS